MVEQKFNTDYENLYLCPDGCANMDKTCHECVEGSNFKKIDMVDCHKNKKLLSFIDGGIIK